MTEKALIVTHKIPDADALASALAVKKIIGKADILVPESLNKMARSMLDGEKVLTEWPEEEYKLIVCVDFSSPEMCPGILERKEKKIVIDHHPPDREFLKELDGYLIDPGAGSTTELVWRIMKELGVEPGEKLRRVMMAGIYYDTVSLRVARKESLLALAELMPEDNKNIAEEISMMGVEPDESEKIARLKACQRARIERENGVIIASAAVSAFEGQTAAALTQVGADVSFVGSKKNKRISARARPWITAKGFDLVEHVLEPVAEKHGCTAGGHKGAAAMQGVPPEKFKEVLLECVENAKKWAKRL